MSSMNSIRDMFFEEAEELLEALSEGLEQLCSGHRDDETVNAVFRAVHSIKGGAGAFNLSGLVAFAHRFETVLDEVRSHRLALDDEILITLQRSADHLADLVVDARDETGNFTAQTADFLAALDACLGEENGPEPEADLTSLYAPVTLDLSDFGADLPPALDVWIIAFRPHVAFFGNGLDPAMFLSALGELGEIAVEADLSQLGDLAGYDPEQSRLGWTVRLATSMPESLIRDVFEFAEGLCDLVITPQLSAEIEVDEAALPAAEDPGEPLVTQAPADVPPAPTVPVPATIAPSEAADGETTAPGEKSGPKPTLRVDLDRVDRLINAVGELIINQSMIAQRLQELRLATDADVVTHVEDYRLLARDIQEAVMAIRAQPVKPLFQRMSRIVRDAAASTGKSARLLTIGEAVEVDKTVVERLADPLTHMIRNAVDHGLELPEDRVAAGKDPSGTIRLSAAHRSGAVIITVRDDGAGLNRPKILEIAKRKGLVPQDAEPSDSEIDSLLFMPGFSTASTVSNLSGRGVGLDVVRNAVLALGGRVTIASTPGKGTEFTISLPLTLAVLDGMVVSVAGQIMVIPISAILETIRPAKHELHMLTTGEWVFAIRGKVIPLVDVAQGLGFVRPPGDAEPTTLLLVETENQGECALIVDRVFDQRQVVIKGLDTNYGSVPGVSAATVLGDGKVALILDPEAIANKRVTQTTDPRAPARTNEGKYLAVA